MRKVLPALCLLVCLLLSSCHKKGEPELDRTQLDVIVSEHSFNNDNDERNIYTTVEVPVSLPNCSLKKVSVQRNKELFMYTAFIEPDQAGKVTRKGQAVELYQLIYYYSSSTGKQSLILARAVE